MSIFINDITDQDTVVIVDSALVTSVNGRIGAVLLNKNDVQLDQVDNTSDLNKPISSATLSALLLKTDLLAFNVLNDLVLNKYGSWDSVHATVNVLSGDWNSVYSNVNVNSGNFLQSQTFVNSNSSNILQIGTKVNTTSANWDYAYNTVVSGLSSDLWNSVYTDFSSQSANNISVYAFVNANSGFESNQQLVVSFVISNSSNIIEVNSIVNNTSANWDSVYTNVNSTSANWDSVYSSVNNISSNLIEVNSIVNNTSANWDSVYSSVNNTSANWDSVYSSVNNTSANWDSVYSNVNLNSSNFLESQTFVNFNSSNIVEVNSIVNNTSANWDSVYTSWNSTSATLATIAFTDSKYLPLSGGTLTGSIGFNNNPLYFNIDSANIGNSYGDFDIGSSNNVKINPNGNLILTQNTGNVGIGTTTPATKLDVNGTITSTGGNSDQWNEAYNNSTTYAVNSASYATNDFVNSNFFNLTGGTISGATRINNNLTVFGNLTATGTTTFANTVFSVTSSLSVVHVGSGPSLWVGNNGDGDIASFYDIDANVEILHVGGNNGTFPNVGVKTSSPNVDFTVNGQISANNTIWSAGGNSNKWNSVYSQTNLLSSNWDSVYSQTNLLSSNWNSGSGFQSQSANNASVFSSWNSASATSIVSFNDTRFPKLSSQAYTLVNATSSIQPIRGNNTASGNYSNVAGGLRNTTSGCMSFVGGGLCNIASGNRSTIAGGEVHRACGAYSVVVGGSINNAIGACSSIVGGCCNNTCGGSSIAVGGQRNTASGYTSNVVGGFCNTASGAFSNVIGGVCNRSIGDRSTIAGGTLNTTSGYASNIAGGASNTTLSDWGSIAGGLCNRVTSRLSNIAGGWCNIVSGNYSNIAGGWCNTASANYSFIAGGSANDTRGLVNTFILGTSLSAVQPNFTYVNNLSSQGLIAANRGDSNNWNQAFNIATVYQNTSGSFVTNTLLQSTSSLLTPLTLTNTLTSQLITNTTFNNYRTDVSSATSTLLPTTIYQNASGNWQSTFGTVSSLSANWCDAYTNLVLNSAAYIATPVYGTTNQIIATPGGGNSVTLSLPTEMVIPNNLSVIGNFFVSGSATQVNTTNLVVNDPLVYVANNNIANINDIGVIGRFNNGLSQSTGLVRSATTGDWTLFSGITANLLSATNINFDEPTFKVDTLRANIVGNVTGTIYDWMTLVRGYKTTPTLLQTIAGGDVYTYIYATSASDRTYYRYIANNGSEDSFYGNFVGGTLSNLITRKAIIL